MNKLFKVIDKKIEKTLLPYRNLFEDALKWIETKELNQINIKSFDNLNLNATYIKNNNEKYILILSHGYRSNPIRDLYSGLKYYYDMGCSVLLIESRACDSSEGRYITFGYKESKDINTWVNYMHKKNKNTPIILGGISLGASSTLMTNNKHVKLMFVDCPYDDAYKEVRYVINHYYHLPAVIFMPMISLFFRIFIGKKLKDINVYDNLDKIDIPILIFHGTDDEFIPYNSSVNIYNYYKHDKELLLFDNADHGMSFLVDKNRYVKKIKEFINKYMI